MNSHMSALAKLVGEIGNGDFEQQFYDFSRELLNVNQCTVFRFVGGEQPECLLAEAHYSHYRSLIRGLAQEYAREGYQRDPNLSGPNSLMSGGNRLIVRCVSPSHVRDVAFRRRFYDEAMVRQELAMIASVNDQTLYCSFYRSEEQKDFASEDAYQLQQLGNFLIQTLGKHAEVTGMRVASQLQCPEPATLSPERRERMYHELRSTLLKAPGALTQREAEICASIALGYTTLGISLKLGISINTVATHRKRAYAKLGISSQNELFARYFDNMGGQSLH
ncbi:helix-turn-helix transcriptional regulator [Pseudomonas citronellolis]|uniref:helix-turn-helix transcriptional regulator n=1 Tax=Pseudomonas citronellolis TaxID=53408 RepID=UPI000727BE9B|nr:helix-turn-helix transcriptional regulator [Pseudomonas citronellolis]KRV76347.1 hypothetical protein AO742_12485 [Pseudomonas citronellolis]